MTEPLIQALCVCDYPLKRMIYTRLLESMGLRQLDFAQSVAELGGPEQSAKQVILVDLNIATSAESDCLATIQSQYPSAHVLMMEEDHEDIQVECQAKRCIARVGKRAGFEEVQNLLSGWIKPMTQKRKRAKTSLMLRPLKPEMVD